MKRFIKYPICAGSKFYSPHIVEDEWQDRLSIPVSSVQGDVLKNVDPQDLPVFQYLVDNKIIPTLVRNHDMRNNPYYDIEDKFIQKVSDNGDSRTYSVPYSGSGRYESGDIFTKNITIYDDGMIQFESGDYLDPYKYAINTLKNYWRRS